MTHEEYLANREDFLRKHLVSHHGYVDTEPFFTALNDYEISDVHRIEHTHNRPIVAHRHTD